MRPNIDRLSLTTAGEKRYNFAGHSLFIVDTSSVTAAASLRINNNTGQGFNVGRGFALEHFPITEVHLSWAAQSGEWIDIVVVGTPQTADPGRSRVTPKVLASAVEISNEVAVVPGASPIEVVNGASSTLLVDINGGSCTVAVEPGQAPIVVQDHPHPFAVDMYQDGDGWAHVGDDSTSTSYVSIYTVPVGKVLTILGCRLSTAGGAGLTLAHARVYDGSSLYYGDVAVYRGAIENFWRGRRLAPGCEIEIKTDSGTYAAEFAMWGILADE